MMQHSIPGRLTGTALALSLGLALSACGGVPTNRSMNSVHQPIVETSNYTLDVSTAGAGLAYGEQARVADWFDALNLKYGDKVYVDDPAASPATRNAIEAVAQRYGIMLSAAAPQTEGYVQQGNARIVIVRSRAYVPGCPDWSAKSDFNPNNGLTSNFGCASNSNLAAMVADPQDLIEGAQTTGDTVVMSSNRAISSYREADPTGKGNTVKQTSSEGN